MSTLTIFFSLQQMLINDVMMVSLDTWFLMSIAVVWRVSIDTGGAVSLDTYISTLSIADWRVLTSHFDLWFTRSKSSASTSKSYIPLLLMVFMFMCLKQKKEKFM